MFLEIDNRKCSEVSSTGEACFQTASAAAEFLAAKASKHTLTQSFPIYEVNGLSSRDDPDREASTNTKYVLFGILLVFVIGACIGIIVTTKRKRASGITWFPEGFLRTNSSGRHSSRRRGPDGQEMRNLHKQAALDHDRYTGPNQHWSDDEPQPKKSRGLDGGYASDHTVVTDYEEAEPRHWTQQHLEAADIRPPAMLTPPRGNDVADVNTRGPCGITPIMVAVVRGGGLDMEEDDDEDETFQELIQQGKVVKKKLKN